jgi:thiamine biosynthesis lipoprotein
VTAAAVPQPPAAAAVASVSFPALGTTAVVAVTDSDRLAEARARVNETIQAYDRACSRFRADSELSALNARAGGWITVSPLLYAAIEAGIRAAALTGGAVDPTVGAALIALGYDRDFAALRGRTRCEVVPVPGWRTVQLDPPASAVRVGRGVRLDLGATAKAQAADGAAAAAARACRCGVLVSLGGDLSLAGDPPPDGWPVRVTDDHRAGVGAPGQWISLHTGGLATSSMCVRQWRTEDGSIAHHLVDPASGGPACARHRTVSVAAASCLEANIASTAALVRGDGEQWLRSLGLPARLAGHDGEVVHLGGWPAEGEDLG